MKVKGTGSWCVLEECAMQGLILAAITAAEKCILFLDST